MPGPLKEILPLKREIVEKWSGLSLDIGGSGAKVVYRDKEDYDNGKPKFETPDGTGRVRCALLARQDIESYFRFISDHSDISRLPGETTEVWGTGVGCHYFKDRIEADFGVKLVIGSEFDYFVSATHYLIKHLSPDVILSPHSPEGIALGTTIAKQLSEITLNFKAHTEGESALGDNFKDIQDIVAGMQTVSSLDNVFPCMLVMCGSAFGLMKIEENGNFMMVDGKWNGGRSFIGLCSLLTGERNFDHLMEMVEKGVPSKVDTLGRDIRDIHSSEANLYSGIPDDLPVYMLGKAAEKPRESFNNVDIVASVLNSQALDLVQFTQLVCQQFGIKNALFAGNYCQPPQVRKYISKHYMLRTMFNSKPGESIRMDTMTHGGYLGAIGALLASVGIKLEKPKPSSQTA